MYKGISRRDFLKASGGLAAGSFLASGLPAFAQDGVTIRSHTRSGRQADAQRFWAEQFNEAMAGEAQVVIEDFPGSEYFQKINTLAAGGTMGDVIWISSIEGYFRLPAWRVKRIVRAVLLYAVRLWPDDHIRAALLVGGFVIVEAGQRTVSLATATDSQNLAF